MLMLSPVDALCAVKATATAVEPSVVVNGFKIVDDWANGVMSIGAKSVVAIA